MIRYLLFFSLILPFTSFANHKPNIVFILSDDMGYGDVQAYNQKSKIPTPHLNQLAKDGILFTDAHAAGSVCVPSRYGLMTGRYPMREPDMKSKFRPVIPKGQTTIASLLRGQGYDTQMVGKWHLGFEMYKAGDQFVFNYAQPLKAGPADHGFNSFFGMHASLDIPPYFFIKDRSVVLPPTNSIEAKDSIGTDEGWNHIQGEFWRAGPVSPDFVHEEITPRFQSEAVKVIDNYGKSSKSKPMFLYLALPSPHTPWLPIEQFRGKSGAGMYGDFVMHVDHVVGEVRKALKRNNLSENTLIMFSSDNGPVWYDKDREKFSHDAVGGLKGMKFSSHEGGHRVPFLASWPAQIKKGATCDSPISFVDVYSTFAEITGAKYADNQAEDSYSFWKSLKNPETKQDRAPILHDKLTIRKGDLKLILPKKKNQKAMLFNVASDLGEHTDLAADQPQKVKAFESELKKMLK